MSNVRLSLVIPTYNRGSLIGETLDSAIAQSPSFHEIIVVDDGSTDDTQTVLASYRDRVQVIQLENGGVQRARNAGVDVASGDYVVFCDSDDLFEPDFVATITSGLAAYPNLDALYCNFRPFNQQGIQKDKLASAPPGFFEGARHEGAFCLNVPDLYPRMLAYQPFFPTGSVLRKTFYHAIGGYDPHFHRVGSEDLEFTLRAVDRGQFAVCTSALTRVRKHDANESADTLRQVSGEIAILEFALQHHAAARHYRDAVLHSLEQRRLDVFNMAFARGDFGIAATMLAQLNSRPHDRKFKLKALITHLPRLLRGPVWRASQA